MKEILNNITECIAEGDYKKAEEIIKKEHVNSQAERITPHLSLIATHTESGDLSKAREILSNLLSHGRVDESMYYFESSKIWATSGNLSEALADAQKSLKIDPSSVFVKLWISLLRAEAASNAYNVDKYGIAKTIELLNSKASKEEGISLLRDTLLKHAAEDELSSWTLKLIFGLGAENAGEVFRRISEMASDNDYVKLWTQAGMREAIAWRRVYRQNSNLVSRTVQKLLRLARNIGGGHTSEGVRS